MVIVGGGLAGARAAHYLRAEGYQGDITVVAGEQHYPYQRPPLTKGYLRGKDGLDEVYTAPKDWYEDNNVEVVTGVEATSLDTDTHELSLIDGQTLKYDKLLLATGMRARSFDLPGSNLPGVLTMRTLDDSNFLKSQLDGGGKKLVIIGSGWIGTEVAASATKMGNEVTILDRGDIALAKVLGEKIGADVKKMHEEHGVKFHSNVAVEMILGTEKVEGVVINGSSETKHTVAADLVLIAVGAELNLALAESAGLDIDNGILVDSSLKTSAPDVYAAGDVANIMHAVAGVRIRSEHWAVARATGKAAAFAMLGKEVNYAEIPYFYTDQFEFNMELSGYPHLMKDAEVAIRGDLESRKYIAFWLKDNIVVAGMNVNIWDVNDQIQQLIRDALTVDPVRLTDPDIPLADL